MTNLDTTANDMFESLTGFDQIAIAAHFGEKITLLAKHAQPDAEDLDPFTFLRALVFVDKRRGGMSDVDAFQAAQELTMADTQAYFADDVPVDAAAGKEPSA